MKERILPYLVCPVCQGDLTLERQGPLSATGHVMNGGLPCGNCHVIYPILNGVPFFRATLNDQLVQKNRENFATEWDYFTADLDEEAAEGELKSYFHTFVDYTDLADKIVLEGGCGGGRLCAMVAKRSQAREVFGVDLSTAVCTAFRHTEHLENAHILQADIMQLPFRKGGPFDFVYSVGVLHHMPHPAEGFAALTRHLKPDGKILAWVYGKEGNFLYITFMDPFRRLTSRLPFRVNLGLSWMLSACVWVGIWGVYVPINRWVGPQRAAKVLPLNTYFDYFRRRGFRDFWRTVFDKMIPTISQYIDEQEFRRWFTTCRLDHQIYFRHGHSWLGIGSPEKMTQ